MTAYDKNRYDHPYQFEHLETIGAHLYGKPGEEKMVFIHTILRSEDAPEAMTKSNELRINQFDLATEKMDISIFHASVGTALPFPLQKLKGKFDSEAPHVWASTHLQEMDGKPYLVLFSGGSGFVAIFDLISKQWLACDNSRSPAQFNVPLVASSKFRPSLTQTPPTTSCSTHIISNRYLLVHRVNWADPKNPRLDFDAFDLQARRWLFSFEVTKLFNHSFYDNRLIRWNAIEAVTPNQFYINKIKPKAKVEAVIFGVVKPGDKISVSFNYRPVEATELGKQKELPYHLPQAFPISAKTINQTRSEILNVAGENINVITVSAATEDKKNKLIFITADYWKTPSEISAIEHELESAVHPNSDWQAMRTAVVNIGGKSHLIVTLLNPEFKMLIFSYDPISKKVTQLEDGPTLKFNELDRALVSVNVIHDMRLDRHLLWARSKFPGFYPVRPIAIEILPSKDMQSLLIAYPTVYAPGQPSYPIKVKAISLAPILKIKPTPTISVPLISASESTAPAIEAKESKTETKSRNRSNSEPLPNNTLSFLSNEKLPKNHLGIGLMGIKLLLETPAITPKVTRTESKSETKESKSEIKTATSEKPATLNQPLSPQVAAGLFSDNVFLLGEGNRQPQTHNQTFSYRST